MNAILLPVKPFDGSKQRLAEFLSPAERALLAQAMFEDVWATLRRALELRLGLDRLLVITAEPYVLARCKKEGIACMEESAPVSHSESVNRATPWAMSLGVTSLLSVPIDTPGVTADELVAISHLRHQFAVVVAPSADGTGTNALLRTPPDAIGAHFGPDSRRRHLEEARAKGLSSEVFQCPGLMADVDTPEDLEQFLRLERRCRTRTFVEQALKGRREIAACR
ncbi:MAG: 2-phospho-L-lactate guanylyltransferase [Acidobacteria bacterium]|nr:2-phospho-L-lactate guanylyltransferase [Acidobacteriota bacterium]